MVKKFNLANPTDLTAFNRKKLSVLYILKNAYGRKYFGDEVYNEKLNNNPYIIYLFYKSKELQGVLIRKPSGKLTALAVLPQFQKQGVGSKLLEYAKREHIKLFGEVCNSNKKMIRLMKLTGFKNVGAVFDKENLVCQDDEQIKILFEYLPQSKTRKIKILKLKRGYPNKLKKIRKSRPKLLAH
ncbi:MAG: GNAT family N-acetyltransferase [Saprospiraceae bacterium]|jgi:GNAT superfamily N-acetyltransferase|nr:GNAT family N-acetyltransferase [Saprospiraceae bacterium]